jgi:hypothetical protein
MLLSKTTSNMKNIGFKNNVKRAGLYLGLLSLLIVPSACDQSFLDTDPQGKQAGTVFWENEGTLPRLSMPCMLTCVAGRIPLLLQSQLKVWGPTMPKKAVHLLMQRFSMIMTISQ